MKIVKYSTLFIFSIVTLLIAFSPLSAHRHHHKQSRMSFSINFGALFTPPERQIVYVEKTQPVYVREYVPVVQERVYVYPKTYQQPVYSQSYYYIPY